MRKPTLRSIPTSGKHGRLSKTMYIPTTLSAVIQQSTIRHSPHIIIRHCWLIMLLNGDTSPTQLHISVHYKMLVSWQLNHYSSIVIRFDLIEKGELSRNIIQFFCLTAKKRLVHGRLDACVFPNQQHTEFQQNSAPIFRLQQELRHSPVFRTDFVSTLIHSF